MWSPYVHPAKPHWQTSVIKEGIQSRQFHMDFKWWSYQKLNGFDPKKLAEPSCLHSAYTKTPYLHMWQTCCPDVIHGQLGASKAHKVGLFWEKLISEQPPTRGGLNNEMQYKGTETKTGHSVSSLETWWPRTLVKELTPPPPPLNS